MEAIFSRLELMLGKATLDAVADARVAVFGVGGVGSWCAESLVRSGVRRMMLVDADRVCESNINRQLMATTQTVGEIKVVALARRLREINPSVELELRPQIYAAATADAFDLSQFDYVIDAIDSLESKALLIRNALAIPSVTLFSSMGAALKMDAAQIRHSDFRKVEGDGLARALRQRFKRLGRHPARKFNVVCSTEPPAALDVRASVMQVTAVFGLALASEVIRALGE